MKMYKANDILTSRYVGGGGVEEAFALSHERIHVKDNAMQFDLPADPVDMDTAADSMEMDPPADAVELDLPANSVEMDSPADAVEMDSPADSVEMDSPADVRVQSIPVSKDTTSHNDNGTDTAFPSSKSVQRKTPQLIIKRRHPRLGVGAICRHGSVRTRCKICDSVGYKISRIRSCVAGGLKRVGTVKNMKTLQYLGVHSFDCFIKHMQMKMDLYNSRNPTSVQMTFDNIELDHIKPTKAFGDEINHYTNLQPLLPAMNAFKSAKWSKEDDIFWRENIQNNAEYSDIYMGTCMSPVVVDSSIERDRMPNISPSSTKTEEEPGTKIRLEDPAVRRTVSNKCTKKMCVWSRSTHIAAQKSSAKELNDKLILWKKDVDSSETELFDSRLLTLRDLPANTNSSVLSLAKKHVSVVFASFSGDANRFACNRIDGIFLHSATAISNQNMLFAIYKHEKLLEIQERDHLVKYDLPNALTTCSDVLLLHDLIAVFNVGMPAALHLKVYDITLSLTQYNEDDEVVVPDAVWQLFVFKCRSVKKPPTTRKMLIAAICMFSRRTFGKHFTDKAPIWRPTPNKKGVMKSARCYNYTGNDLYLRVHMCLADWSKRDLDDIEPVIVAKYQLGRKGGVSTIQLKTDTLLEAKRREKLLEDIQMHELHEATRVQELPEDVTGKTPAHVECVEDHVIPEKTAKRQCVSHVHPTAITPVRRLGETAVRPRMTDLENTTFTSLLARPLGLPYPGFAP